jgi:hypothetical protein
MGENIVSRNDTKFEFWVSTFFEIFLDAVFVGMLLYFGDIKKNFLACILILMPIVGGYVVSAIFYHVNNFRRKFGHYPWRKKPIESYECDLDYHDL